MQIYVFLKNSLKDIQITDVFTARTLNVKQCQTVHGAPCAAAPFRPLKAEGLFFRQWPITMPTETVPATVPVWHGPRVSTG